MGDSGIGSSGQDIGRRAGLVTFVLGDVEGSTALWEASPDAAAAGLARFRDLVGEAIARRHGVQPLEQGEGDNFVAAFDRPTDGLSCAIDLQRQFMIEPWPDPARLRVRIGVHTGEALFDDHSRYSGQALNRCARIRDVAFAGQVLISSATYELVADALPDDVDLRPVGDAVLRGLGRHERLWQLCHPDLPDGFGPLPVREQLGSSLPNPLTSFVGRRTELAAVPELFASARMVTLTGPGGCGKTRLAIEIARRPVVSEEWRVFVGLSGLGDGHLVASSVASAAGAPQPPSRSPIESLQAHLQARKVLLVLDNCEHVIDAVALLAHELLSAAPQLRILATSREPVGVPGEVVYRVPSLPIGDKGADDDAVVLLRDRANAVRPGFQIDASNRDAIIAICRRLDGIPLALELAAAQLRLFSPTELAADLQLGFERLTGSSRDGLARQQTLDASVAWSYELLGPDEQLGLQRLSVFAGGFDMPAFRTVCSDEALDTDRLPQVLSRLVDCSLVHRDEDDGRTRFKLLESVRVFSLRQLAVAGDGDRLRRRHAEHFARTAATAGRALERSGLQEWAPRLEADLDNFRTAMEWALEHGQHDNAAQIAAGLWLFWARDRLTEGRYHLDRVLAHTDLRSEVRGQALFALGDLAILLGDLTATRAAAEQLVELAQATDDRWWLNRGLNLHAWADFFSGEAGAYARFERAAELHREVDDTWCLADTLLGFGMIAVNRGDATAAQASFDEAVRVARDAGNEGNVQRSLSLSGFHACLQGRVADARAALRQAIAIGDRLGETTFTSYARIVDSYLDALVHDPAAAADQLRDLLSDAQAADNHFAIAIAASMLTQIAYRQNVLDPVDAIEASEIAQRAGLYYLGALDLELAARAALDHDDATKAQELVTQSLALADAAGSRWTDARARLVQLRLAVHRDDLTLAERHGHDALATLLDCEHLIATIEALEALGGVAARQNKGPLAIRILAATDNARAQLGYSRGVTEEADRIADLERARASCRSDDEFTSATAEGQAMTLAQAAAYIRRGRGQRGRPTSGWSALTPTEREVVRLVAQGLRNIDVADQLFIAAGTVKVHLTHIFSKLGVDNRAQLAAAATTHQTQAINPEADNDSPNT